MKLLGIEIVIHKQKPTWYGTQSNINDNRNNILHPDDDRADGDCNTRFYYEQMEA